MERLFEKQYSFLQRLVPLDDERAQELEGRVSILPPTLELIHKSHRLTGYLLLSFTAEWKDKDLEVSTLLFSGDVNDIRYQYEKKTSFPLEPEPFAPLQNYLDAIAAAGSNGGNGEAGSSGRGVGRSGGRGSGVVDDSSGRTRGAGGTAEDGEHFWILEINKNNWSQRRLPDDDNWKVEAILELKWIASMDPAGPTSEFLSAARDLEEWWGMNGSLEAFSRSTDVMENSEYSKCLQDKRVTIYSGRRRRLGRRHRYRL
jgi:hypothetical protein